MVAGLGAGSTDPRAPRAIDAAITAGTVLGGRYELVRRIGGGSMGAVWRVHDLRADEDIALKVLPPRASAEALARFRREVTLARRIAHPNVCRVFDLGDPDGLHVLTMELITGENLRARLVRGPLAWPEAKALIADILAGLAAVHAAGVVHRDIKPENIVVAADGRAVIVDFGLACTPAIDVATVPEVGTPQYMAPEQLAGEAVDPRSDVFAAGIAIQEILDGRPPFEGATAALVSSAILRDRPRPLEGRAVPDELRPAVAQVLARALGRDRATRPADAGELRRDWLAAIAGARSRRPHRRRGVTLGVAAGALALLGGATVIELVAHGHHEAAARAHARSVAGHTPRGGAIAKPPTLVIEPPWAAGASHTIVQGYDTLQHQNTSSASHSNDYYALDFDLAPDEPVYPIAAGSVVYAGPAIGGWAGYGTIVLLDHVVDGAHCQSLYAHLASVAELGDSVSTTTILGRAGHSGTSRVELHLAIYCGASLARTTVGTGPYGGVAVVPEPFASCTRGGGACTDLAAGDTLVRARDAR